MAIVGIGERVRHPRHGQRLRACYPPNKEQLELELQNIPDPTLPRDVRDRQFDRFQQNIDQTGAGLPKMVGIERPKEIKQRIESEEAQKQGSTHVYDPNQKKAVPVGSWVQRHFQGMPGVEGVNP